MKYWKKNLLIGLIVALSSEFYLNVFVSNFRISPSVILFPVLIMTLGRELRTMDMAAAAACGIFRGTDCVTVCGIGSGYGSGTVCGSGSGAASGTVCGNTSGSDSDSG